MSIQKVKIFTQDIQRVQNLIERCLKQYMNQKEAMNTLWIDEKIEPHFTELVWKKLEEENQEFFKAYHLKLMAKVQIIEFNRLLAKQVELMHQLSPSGGSCLDLPKGSNYPPVQEDSAYHAPAHIRHSMNPETIPQYVGASLPNSFNDYNSSMQPSVQTNVDMSAHGRSIDFYKNMLLDESSSMLMMQGIDEEMIKAGSGHVDGSSFIFGANGSVLEPHSAMENASISSFNGVDLKPLNEMFLDAEAPSFGNLGQISQDFYLSDVTSDYSNISDILDGYSRPSFQSTDTESFLDLHGHARGENHGDINSCRPYQKG